MHDDAQRVFISIPGYARVLTYPFVPAGLGLRPTWTGDDPG